MIRTALAAASLVLVLACASSPPGPVGSLNGIAVDGNGNALPGVTVSLQSAGGKIVQTVVTLVDGSYSFQDVPVGQYQVTTTFAGFTAARPLPATVTAGAMTALPPLTLLPPDTTGNGPAK